MSIDPPFPDDRRSNPMWRAERRIYRQLAESAVAGRALYQVRSGSRDRELDFLVFLEDAGRIGIEVKGGSYRLFNGDWQLRTPDGWQWKPSPLLQLLDAVDSLQESIGQHRGREVAVIPVLAFPDMKGNRDIEFLAASHGVHVIWQTGGFTERLTEIAQEWARTGSPAEAEIDEEVRVIRGERQPDP